MMEVVVILVVFMLIIVALIVAMLLHYDHKVAKGYIVGKRHYQERINTKYDSSVNGFVSEKLPEHFTIIVADSKGMDEINVSEAEYNQCKEGDKWER
jgi:hypothetical protein